MYIQTHLEIFNVTFTSKEAQTMTVKVVNMIGEEIYKKRFSIINGKFNDMIDLTGFAKGVYTLEIIISQTVVYNKIVLH